MSKPAMFFIALLFLVAGGTVLAVAWKNRDTPPVAGFGGESAPSQTTATEYVEYEPLEEFTLTDSQGKSFSSKDLEGSVWVATFFFTTCPFDCLRQNMRVAELETEFGDQGVKFLSITCDPKTDTPLTLDRYANKLNADPDSWKFLTGDLHYIQRVGGEMFKVSVQEKTHAESLILVDQQGHIRGYYHWNEPSEIEKMKQMISDLLSGKAPPVKADRKEPAESEPAAAPAKSEA